MSKLNPPASVRIGWATFKIILLDESAWLDKEETVRELGCCDNFDETISIFINDDRPQQAANTLLHEIMHGCMAQSGAREARVSDEEFVVTALTNALQQVMMDNPEVMSWIMQHSIPDAAR